MLHKTRRPFSLSLHNRDAGVQWAMLLVLSALFSLALAAVHLPATLLLGPMVAAIVVAAAGGGTRVPRHPFIIAQAVVGCLMARSIPPAVLGEIFQDLPLFLAAVLAVIGISSVLGWLMMRWRVLPGTTAVWGSSPGAAMAMILMAEAYGADIRLVAAMQYLRVFLVVIVASVVSRLWTTGGGGPVAHAAWFPPIAWGPFAETLALVALGAIPVPFPRIPARSMLVPMAAGLALQQAGLVTIELPRWLLAISYAFVGWSIGMRFNRSILLYTARTLPRLVASNLVLIVLCGGLAALLVALAGIDPLTAYLATSPGGADSAAIIAASTSVNLPFVMAMQTTRFIVVLLLGPSLARLIAGRATPQGGSDAIS